MNSKLETSKLTPLSRRIFGTLTLLAIGAVLWGSAHLLFRLAPGAGTQIGAGTESPQALALFQRAETIRSSLLDVPSEINEESRLANDTAEALLEQAVAIDPNFAMAWVALSSIHATRYAYENILELYPASGEDHAELARSDALTALEIDPNFEPALSMLALIEVMTRNTQNGDSALIDQTLNYSE